jgi:hypothetical protein
MSYPAHFIIIATYNLQSYAVHISRIPSLALSHLGPDIFLVQYPEEGCNIFLRNAGNVPYYYLT